MQKLIYSLDHIHQITGIPIRCLNESGDITIFSKGYNEYLDPIQNTSLKDHLMTLFNHPTASIIKLEDNMIGYATLKDILNYKVILGPVAFRQASNYLILKYSSLYNVKRNDFFIVNRTKEDLISAISILYTIRFDKVLNKDQLIISKNPQKISPTVDEEYHLYRMANTEEDKLRLGYETELVYLQSIRDGVVLEYPLKNRKKIVEEQIGKLAKQPIKQYEYTVCTSIALATRAAIEGGVAVSTAYAISDLYLQRLEKCKSIIEMTTLQLEMQNGFARQVRQAKRKHTKSNYVERCNTFISKHLNKNFTIDDIANEIGINKAHLSRVYKKEMGETIMEYTRKMRIEAAQNMLKYSDKSISIIASYLCFPSQSHFGKTFKNITGTTPKTYRDGNQIANF